MELTTITGASSFVERVKIVRFGSLLVILVFMAAVARIAIFEFDWVIKAILILLFIGISIVCLRKEIAYFRLGLRVLLKGEAEVEINADGFLLRRRAAQELYQWKAIKKIVLWTTENTDKTKHEIAFELSDGRDITVEDDSSWTSFHILRNWSDGYIDLIGWSQEYDSQGNRVVDSSMPA